MKQLIRKICNKHLEKLGSLMLVSTFCLISLTSCTQNSCDEIPGLESLLSSGNVIMLGEIHGTKEAPYFIGQMACQGLEQKLKVTVGLELPKRDQIALNEFMNSAGKAQDKAKFLSLPYWTKNYQDGRTSQAMFELIEDLRKMKKAGESVNILFVDDSRSPNREVGMSNNILDAHTSFPENLFLILTGNLHNRISEGSGRMGSLIAKKLEPGKVISIAQSHTGGTAWVDMGGGIGVQKLGGNGKKEIGIFLDKEMNSYHGMFEMDRIHASVPAKDVFDFQ